MGWKPPAQWFWIQTILPLLGGLSVLGSMARRLPLQNLAAIGSLVLVLSAAILACGAGSKVPFGPIVYEHNGSLMLFGKVPVVPALWWLAILVSSRETARLILRPWRRTRNYGFSLVGLAALLAVVVNLSWEPFASRAQGLWHWETSAAAAGWYAVSWLNFLGWFVGGVLVLAFTTPWFISKGPVHGAARLDPAVIWCALNLHFVVGNATAQLWLATIVGGGLTVAATWLAWRGSNQSAA